MVNYYRLFETGRIKLEDAKKIEYRVHSVYNSLGNAFRVTQQEHELMIQRSLETDTERTKLVKQLRSGDRGFILTLLHLLDLYTGEGIYKRFYQEMQPPLTDSELDALLATYPADISA